MVGRQNVYINLEWATVLLTLRTTSQHHRPFNLWFINKNIITKQIVSLNYCNEALQFFTFMTITQGSPLIISFFG